MLAVMVLAGGAVGRAAASGPGSIDHSFTFTEDQLEFATGCEHDIVSCSGAQPDHNPARAGRPALPVLTCHFILPPDMEVADLQVAVGGSLDLPGTFWLPPVQAETGVATPRDPAIYDSSEPYPANPAQVTAAGSLHGYHLATVQVWPLRYRPAEGRLELLTSVDISITTREMTETERQDAFVPRRDDWEPRGCRPEVQWLERHLLNPTDLAAFYTLPSGPKGRALGAWESSPCGGFAPTEFPSLNGTPVSMVIITDDQQLDGTPVPAMVATFQAWADWKTSLGVPTVVRTVGWIDAHYSGVDRPEKIRAFVKDAATLWGTDYVLLGGELGIVPTRLLGGPTSGQLDGPPEGDAPADRYYTELDLNWNLNGNAYFAESGLGYYNEGDDIIGTGLGEYIDLWIGRLPVRTAEEAEAVLAKIATYVSRPGSPPFRDSIYQGHVLLAAGTEGDWCSLNAVREVEAIREEILAQSPFCAGLMVSRMYPDISVAATCPRLGQPVRCLQAHYEAMGGTPPDRPFLATEFEDALDSGIGGTSLGYVFHYEHGTREMLGMQHGNETQTIAEFTNPSLPTDLPGCGACRDAADSTQADEDWVQQCANLLRAALPAGWKDDFTKERADRLRNGPDYFVVTSGGCQVNRYERDAVGEHLMRNPVGGAVAFLGSSPNSGLWAGRAFMACTFLDGIEPVGAAGGLAVCGWDLRYALGYSLLGDPQMPLRTRAPGDLAVVVAPPRFQRVGPQTFTVRIADTATHGPVAGARVCLRQADLAYAVAWTGSDGVAVFPSFAPMNMTENVCVTATAQNYKLAEGSSKPAATAPTPGDVVYVNHLFDDHVSGGDNDGIFEPGEKSVLQILARNVGTSAAPLVSSQLRVTAPVFFDLDITGDPGDASYEPENIHIGSTGAHPHAQQPGGTGTQGPAAGETFRLPSFSEAIRAEGEPSPPENAPSRILIWQDETGLWHVCTHCAPGDDDTVFEGTLRTEGGFSEVAGVGLETSGPNADTWQYEASTDPDLVRFLFHGAGDETPDQLLFRADAHLWIDVDPDMCPLGTLPGGDEEIATFGLNTTTLLPDRTEIVFTFATEDTTGRWSFSDFSLSALAPEPRYLGQVTETGQQIHSGWVRIVPALANTGSTGLDGAEVLLHPIWPTDFEQSIKVAQIGPIGPGETAQASTPLYLQRAGLEWIQLLRYDLEFRITQPAGDWLRVWQRDVDVFAPPAPAEVIVDEAGASVILRWEPVTASDVVGYHVYQNTPGAAERLTLAPVTGTTRYEVTGLAALDSSNQYIDYRYSVTAIDASGNESPPTSTSEARVWLPEMPGWPKYIAGGSDCAPKVYDLDGDGDLEVIAAGGAIYAWHHDGRPVIAANADGLLFAPPMSQYPTNGKFVMALAVDQVDRNGQPEIVGNFAPSGVFTLEYNRQAPPGANPISTKWFRTVKSHKSAPILEDLDQGDQKLEIILAGNEANHFLYVWTPEGVTFRDPAHGTNGKFTRIYDLQDWCYQSLSVGDVSSTYPGMEILQALPNGKVVGYRTDQYSLANPLTCLVSLESKTKMLSTPLLGDVDGDGRVEVVTTRMASEGAGIPGGIWILGSDGSTEDWIAPEAPPFRFTLEPPNPAALADLDGNGDLDIVVGGGRHGDAGSGVPGEDPWATNLRLHIVLSGAPVRDTLTVDDHIPVPGRRNFSTATWSQPVIGDIDGDGRLEILVPSDSDYLCCYEWDNTTRTARAESGWPQLFDDVPLTPTLADVDRTTSHLEMLVQDRSGGVHLFGLPGRAEGASLPWPQYGYDSRNTFRWRAATGEGGAGDPAAGPGSFRVAAGSAELVASSTSPSTIEAFFLLAQEGPARLEVFDIQGRRVRVLLAGTLPAGPHGVQWDGRAADGSRAPSGIYLLRLTSPDGARVRRVALTR